MPYNSRTSDFDVTDRTPIGFGKYKNEPHSIFKNPTDKKILSYMRWIENQGEEFRYSSTRDYIIEQSEKPMVWNINDFETYILSGLDPICFESQHNDPDYCDEHPAKKEMYESGFDDVVLKLRELGFVFRGKGDIELIERVEKIYSTPE